MNEQCRWTEEEIIDYILKELKDEEKKNALSIHLNHCNKCQSIYTHWFPLLDKNHENHPSTTTPNLKERIYRTLLMLLAPRHFFKRALFLTSIMVILLISGFVFGRITTLKSNLDINSLVQSSVKETSNQYAALPTAYKVVSIDHQNMKGSVWLNRETKDIMLFLNGLKPMKNRDYQAWIVSENNRKQTGGLVQISEGIGHVYMHKREVEKVRKVIISIEPKGGSDYQTGPDKINFDLSTVDKF